MAAALIDRLVHHCHIVNIRGNSYRLRHHQDLGRALGTPCHLPAGAPKRGSGSRSKEVQAP
ncbi:MAG TPA: ATP-binding protein [Gemmatimonadaceae bacterium]